jgi:GT2 family glycosyltransferase
MMVQLSQLIQNDNMSLCSIICVYHPNDKILINQINVLVNFGDVYIVDNSNILINDFFKDFKNVNLINPNQNLGTLGAYNAVINLNSNYDLYWLWDQDTLVSAIEVAQFIKSSKAIFKSDSKCVATTFLDKKNYVHPLFKQLILAKASTTLFNKKKVEQFLKFSFDEDLFMDYGDFDFTYKIYKSGARIHQIHVPNYTHEFGEKVHTWFGNISKSSNFRIYVQGANTIKIIKKNGFFSFPGSLLILRTMVFPFKEILLFNTASSIIFFFRGILDGIKNKVDYFRN